MGEENSGKMTYSLQTLRQEWAQFSQWTEKKASVTGEEKTEEKTPANKVGEVIGPHPSWIKNGKPLEVIEQCDMVWHFNRIILAVVLRSDDV